MIAEVQLLGGVLACWQVRYCMYIVAGRGGSNLVNQGPCRAGRLIIYHIDIHMIVEDILLGVVDGLRFGMEVPG